MPTRLTTSHYYPFTIDLEYRVLGSRGAGQAGCGQTVKLSSTCLQFVCADDLPDNTKVEISIPWPAQLDNGVGLKLWIVGRTVPWPGPSIAVEIQRHQFRTRSTRTSGITPQGSTRVRAWAASA